MLVQKIAQIFGLSMLGLCLLGIANPELRGKVMTPVIYAVAPYIPPLQTELSVVDGLPNDMPREIPCPNGCDWRARYATYRNPDKEIVGCYSCTECACSFSVEEITRRSR